jgi:signal transduction histidine kinase
VRADKDRINQVIHNLLSNAVKYTPIGGVVELEVVDAPERGILNVKDNGIGIPENELPLIFERFYRTDKSRNRKLGGAGIGLAIVKSIVSAHGGDISVESRPEQGSRFTVRIPKADEIKD